MSPMLAGKFLTTSATWEAPLKIFTNIYKMTISYAYYLFRASLIDQLVNHLPAMQETWVRFLGQEDPLEKEMATHSSILAWRIPWIEKPCRLQSMGLQESDTT